MSRGRRPPHGNRSPQAPSVPGSLSRSAGRVMHGARAGAAITGRAAALSVAAGRLRKAVVGRRCDGDFGRAPAEFTMASTEGPSERTGGKPDSASPPKEAT